MSGRDGVLRIAYYLRDPGNLHYFASLRPYLDHFLKRPRCISTLVVRPQSQAAASVEYRGYEHLIAADADLDRYDLVLTPTHLRDGEIASRARVVQIFHGISDKPFTYERDFSDYALCLCAGERQVDRLLRHAHNRAMRWALVGYPKFDCIGQVAPMFRNGKRTLIYCPTWRKGGLSSIDVFLDAPSQIAALAERYNLIVKPHPNLFNSQREFYDPRIVDALRSLPGVTIVHSGNVMPWMAQADLFLGDISASGYEWLYFNRPAVFINPQPRTFRPGADIDAPTYLWQSGAVCDSMDAVGDAVDAAFAGDRYCEARERLLHYSVHLPRDGSATERGIAEVERLLQRLTNRTLSVV